MPSSLVPFAPLSFSLLSLVWSFNVKEEGLVEEKKRKAHCSSKFGGMWVKLFSSFPSLPLIFFPLFSLPHLFPSLFILYLFDFFVIALFFVLFSFFDNFLWLSHSSMRSMAKFHNRTCNTRMWVTDCASFIWANPKIPTFTSPFLHLDVIYWM